MTIELATIFERFADQSNLRMNLDQHRAFNAVLACRTPALGVQWYRCDHCHREVPRYGSCRNRHCPNTGVSITKVRCS